MLQRGANAFLLSLLLGCVPAGPAVAQTFLSLDRSTPDEGLSQNAITAMVEDDRGLLWIGTQEGLNRYDGHRFHVLRSTPVSASGEASGELVSSSIDALAVDSRSRLWVGTNDHGLEVIDLRTRARRRLGVADGLEHPTVHAILIDPAGGAWLGTATGIEHVTADVDSVRRLGTTSSIVAMMFSAVGAAHALDELCRLWRVEGARIVGGPMALPRDARCVGMQRVADGFWIATAAHGLHHVDLKGRTRGAHAAAWLRSTNAELTAFGRRISGEWLLGYSDGRLAQAPSDWSAPPQLVRFDRPVDSAITGFYLHSSGVLWIGSQTSGLFRARALSATIRRDLVDEAAISGWPARSVRSIRRDGATLLVGTDGGLVMREIGDTDWTTVDAIGATSVRAIAPAQAGGWWVGTHRGLWHLDTRGQARAIPGLPDPRVTDLLVERDGDGEQVWIATRGGLARLRGGAIDNSEVPPALVGPFLTSLLRDSDQRLWIGSNERGVFRIERDGSVQHLGTHNGRLPHDSVWSLHADEKAVWLGTFSGGLLRIDRDTGAVTAITDRDGLSNNVIYRIEPDAKGRLWLTTNLGVNVLDPGTGVIQTLQGGDGLFNLEFNSGASFADGGLLYLGGTDGLDIIEPGRLAPTSPAAIPLITQLIVLGRQGSPGDAPADSASPEVIYSDQVTLGYRDRVLQVDMVAMDFTAPNAARLRYRIDGIHDDWVQPQGAQTSLVLSYLPPGTYPLEVQAAGRDGRFGTSRTLRLQVLPPAWRHPLAYAGYGLLALALVAWMLLRVRARAEQKRAQIHQLNQTVAEHTAALKQANHLLVRSNEKLELATRTDPLTQVSNRRDLQEWLGRECPQFIADIAQPASHTAASGHRMLFCMIDLDDFKRINDNHGHQVGDEVLKEVARRLREVCRERDILVRWGGEEFLLMVRDAHLADATRLAERIRRNIADAPVQLANGQPIAITCSIGLAPWPMSTRWPSLGDWEQSVSLADMAMYAAKESGKNAWVGVLPGPELDRHGVQLLLAGAPVEQLDPGSIEIVHSTKETPRFQRL